VPGAEIRKFYYGQYGWGWAKGSGGCALSRVQGQSPWWDQRAKPPKAGEVLLYKKLTFAVK